MSTVRVVEFTDPACPFAWSAEPRRRRIQWVYEHLLEWETRMVVLAEDADEQRERGMTPDKLTRGAVHLADAHGMPIDTTPRERLSGSAPACRAIVGARLHRPEAMARLLRAFRVQAMAGAPLDEDATLDAAAQDAGLEPVEVLRWARDDEEVRLATDEDMALARHPRPAALHLEHKLASWSGGKRYTCPSWELSEGDRTAVVPGFQPIAAYEVVIAHLVPECDRRSDPQDVREVLEWAGEPLATCEVAAVMDASGAAVREQLAGVADELPFGTDAFWRLRPS